jgi:hypothetical protein
MKKATVHLFVFDTMSDWEYGYLAAGINNPQFQKYPGSSGSGQSHCPKSRLCPLGAYASLRT